MKYFDRTWFPLSQDDTGISRQPVLWVISSSHSQIPNGPIDLVDLLSVTCDSLNGQKTLFQDDSKRAFFLYIYTTSEASPWTFEEGLIHCQQFLRLRKPCSTTFLFNTNSVQESKKSTSKTLMVSILSLQSEVAQSIPISFYDRQTLDENKQITRDQFFLRRNLSFLVVSLILIFMTIALGTTSALGRRHHKSKDLKLWMHWDTKGSRGPHQLQYTYPHPNFTTWAAETNHSYPREDWYVRIDDQSMIPPHLVDDDEIRYQEWYRTRYPNFEAVRSSGDYLNETFYKHALQAQLEIDHPFHVTHCILVMKRYWRARESGRHVCPRDLDHAHIAHCFEVLEELAIDGLPGTPPPNEQTHGTSIAWIVNACF
ncbi:hypothetical protein BGZ60DRAFT_408899 [Tricladium varicosporioides]|nr:hypothetical protein BGZ60DRAFT_408899 [Hymenoscyphus varicosporioides]